MSLNNYFVLAALLLSAALTAAAPVGGPDSPVGDRVLVLLDTHDTQSTHSIFFQQLSDTGFSLSFALADSSSITLTRFGEYLYDHVIVFAPWSAQWGKGVSVNELTAFIDSGRNVLLAADVVTEKPTRALAEAVGIIIERTDGALVDHFNYDTTGSNAANHTGVLASVPAKPSPIVQTSLPGPVLYQGTAISLTDNPLLVPLLEAPSTSFVKPASGPVSDSQASLAGAPVLVAALQARNNARVVVTGSVDAFSNEAFAKTVAAPGQKAGPSGNTVFLTSVVQWTFQLRGALRYSDVSISLEDGSSPDMYTINDRIVFSFSIMQWVDSAWVPYQAKDVQMEFVMLDPYLRAFMTPSTNGTFSHTFTAPDVYGVFTFNVDYRRLGYSNIVFQERIPVRPYRHDQYERFIVAAYPYYAASISMMVGLCALSWFFLFHHDSSSDATAAAAASKAKSE